MGAPQEPATESLILRDETTGKWLRFENPVEIVSTYHRDEVLPLLNYIERKTQDEGFYAAGYVGYEASPAFDASLSTFSAGRMPMCWFGLYDHPKPIELPDTATAKQIELAWEPEIDPQTYTKAIRQIKGYIAEGDTYQVNYSFRMAAGMPDNPWEYFLQMIRAQGEKTLGAYMNTGDWCICSASPELFFSLNGDRLASRPMKGTRKRGLWSADDKEAAHWLLNSSKNKAENVMIVDMVRNDLSRIARGNTVETQRLFELEKYNTLWQLTSTVSCHTSAGIADIFKALFPASSITGAPKTSTMRIIHELENSPRDIYTGSIGYVAPGRRAQFNVAIRTVWMDSKQRTSHYGVGGGIVWDSSGHEELQECKTKAKVLNEYTPDFSLLETLLWEPQNGYFLLQKHLSRLLASADYFDFKESIDTAVIKRQLQDKARHFKNAPYKVRLTVPKTDPLQGMEIQGQLIHAWKGAYHIALADIPVDSNNPFLYHKTTYRSVYEQARARVSGVDDVLLHNEKGEVTESCIANVVAQFGKDLLTPPLKSGLLDGVFRRHLLDEARIRECVLTPDDLLRCDKLYLINSVRRWWEPVWFHNQIG